MGQPINQQLSMDPDYLRSQILRQREQGFQQIQNPFQQSAARLGSLLGGGIANVANDRGFFEVSDPLLTKVTQIQNIYSQVAEQVDPAANPEQFFSALSTAYSKEGLGQQAMLAMQEGNKLKKDNITTQAAEFELFRKNPEIITRELQALVPGVEAGDPKATQRYNELSNLMVRANNDKNLDEESKRADIEYKRALGNKAGKENVSYQPLMNAAGMRVGTEIYENGTYVGAMIGGKFRPAGNDTTAAPASTSKDGKPNTSGGRPRTGDRNWDKAFDN